MSSGRFSRLFNSFQSRGGRLKKVVWQLAALPKKMRLIKKLPALAPGDWVFEGPDVWLLRGSSAPTHIFESKGTWASKNSLAWSLIRRSVGYFAAFAISEKSSGSCTVAIPVAENNKSFICFDFVDKKTYRYSSALPGMNSQQSELRRLWSGCVPAVTMFREESADGLLVEQLVTGMSAREASHHDRMRGVRVTMSSYQKLGTQHSVGTAAERLECFEAMLLTSEHRALLERAKSNLGVQIINAIPMAPRGSDNSPNNVILTKNGPVFIDVFPMSIQPITTHPLGIIAAWDSESDLLDAYLRGELDTELCALLGDTSLAFTPQSRFALVLFSMALGYPEPSAKNVAHLDWLLEVYGLSTHERARAMLRE